MAIWFCQVKTCIVIISGLISAFLRSNSQKYEKRTFFIAPDRFFVACPSGRLHHHPAGRRGAENGAEPAAHQPRLGSAPWPAS